MLYPSGANIITEYSVNTYNLSINDTLVITRLVGNNETFDLNGIYFSENLPPEFTVVSHSIRIDGGDIPYQYDNNIIPPIVNGYSTCEWLVDNPSGTPDNSIGSGQTLILEIKIICITPGQYQLPFHTASFYGNEAGFFSIDNEISIVFSEPPDTTPPAAIGDLEAISGQ